MVDLDVDKYKHLYMRTMSNFQIIESKKLVSN